MNTSRTPGQTRTRIKKWLKNNKIYFETVTASSLAIMAVIISVFQFIASSKQNDLIAAQLAIARQSTSPNIYAYINFIKNPKSGHYDEEDLSVYNSGTPVTNVNVNTATWLYVTLIPKPGNHNKIAKLKFAVNAYYSSEGQTQQTTGLLYLIQGYHNHLKFNELQKNLRDIGNKKNYFTEIELKRYIKVTYVSTRDKREINYLLVNPMDGSVRIPLTVGHGIFEQHDALLGSKYFLDFDEVTANRIFSIL